jgi:UDP-2,3-diacylglucosamine hydrolase
MKKERNVVYFVSDMHFGVPDRASSIKREQLFVQWLDEISQDASDVFIMGDMFDFWFEWKHVVPKGYIRLLGKFAQLSDLGIQFHFFIGNHDMWMFSYFEKEFGAKIYRRDTILKIQEKTFYLSHGDGLGPGDNGYKILKKLFRCKFAQWCYARLHPNFAVGLAMFFSGKSRKTNKRKNAINSQRERQLTESQKIFATQYLQHNLADYFIFGHQHTPCSELVSENAILINIGNWITDFSYLKLKNGEVKHFQFVDGEITPL